MNYLITTTKSYHTATAAFFIPVGIFYLANQLHRIGQPFTFISLNEVNDSNGTVYLSYFLSDHLSIVNTSANKIVIGGTGAIKNNVTIPDKELLIFHGAASYFDIHTLVSCGEITRPFIPKDVEIPIIPKEYLKNMTAITFNNGSGCSYGCCSFCTRTEEISLDPEITAEAIVRIYGKYKKQVQLSLDGPSRNYLDSICNIILKKNIKAKWGCSAMVINLDKELINKLFSAGCVSLGIGLEYIEDNVLNAISKGSTVSEYFKTIETMKTLGMFAHFCIIDFDSYVPTKYKQVHHNNLKKILNEYNPKFSFSVSKLKSNTCTDRALKKLFRA